VPPQRHRVGLEPGPGQVDGDDLGGGVVVLLALGRDDLHLVVVLDHQAGAVAADREPVEPGGQLGDLALAQVVALQSRAGRVVVQVRDALTEHAGDWLAQPDQAVFDRPQARVPALGHGHAHHAAGQGVRVD
jgi:hypothetical protein